MILAVNYSNPPMIYHKTINNKVQTMVKCCPYGRDYSRKVVFHLFTPYISENIGFFLTE